MNEKLATNHAKNAGFSAVIYKGSLGHICQYAHLPRFKQRATLFSTTYILYIKQAHWKFDGNFKNVCAFISFLPSTHPHYFFPIPFI